MAKSKKTVKKGMPFAKKGVKMPMAKMGKMMGGKNC